MKKLSRIFFGLTVILGLTAANAAASGENTTKTTKRAQEKIQIRVVASGLNNKTIEAAKLRVEQSAAVQNMLKGTKYRLLEFNYIENESKSQLTQNPTHFRAVFYDYTNERTVVAEGDFAGKEAISIREDSYQPVPNDEEFEEAVRILQQDANLSASVRDRKLNPFRPMPPITVLDGTKERLVNVGLDAAGDESQNEVVSVSIKNSRVIRYPKGAPAAAKAAADTCGIPASNQETTAGGTPGQFQITVSQDGLTLWEMLVIRPSASSGTRASGIEVRNVKHKGKSVLKRGHTPVLNVQYPGGQCGPYRDWQHQEDPFQAPAAGAQNIADGIRILAPGQAATTSLETGDDTGNFRGVAIYTQNNETVMVSEMQAGWYRYIMEWRFANDGTIRPRYGFGATNNSCVCSAHNHHIYWRLDFDIVSPTNKVFQVERGRKFLQPITTETRRNKSLQTNRSLLIQNSNGNEAYILVPNITDGLVDTFGVNDFWVLRYKNVPGGTNVQNEIDDGVNCFTCTTAYIQINPFVNDESVENQDVVVWYGAHFNHSDGENLLNPSRSPTILSGSHVVGPDIRPIRW